MSWVKKAVKKVAQTTDRAASGLDADIRQRGNSFENEYKRWGRQADPYVKAAGYGSYGWQANLLVREGAKKSGYSKDEAADLGDSLGADYQGVAADKTMRIAGEDAAAAAYRQSVIQSANDRAARLSREVRIRRRGMGNLPGNKSGTLLTGALGLLGGTSATLGA